MRYHYPGIGGRPAFCDLAFTVLPDGTAFVVCSEDLDNTGTSVTNAAETIASQLCQEQPAIDLAKLVWIERYPPRGSRHWPIPESFDLVTFRTTDPARRTVAHPAWKPLSEQDVQALRTDTLGPAAPAA